MGEYHDDMLDDFTPDEDEDMLPLSDAELLGFGLSRNDLIRGSSSALVLPPVSPASSTLHNATAAVTLGAGSLQGRRKTMEDRYVLLSALGSETTSYWGVYVP